MSKLNTEFRFTLCTDGATRALTAKVETLNLFTLLALAELDHHPDWTYKAGRTLGPWDRISAGEVVFALKPDDHCSGLSPEEHAALHREIDAKYSRVKSDDDFMDLGEALELVLFLAGDRGMDGVRDDTDMARARLALDTVEDFITNQFEED